MTIDPMLLSCVAAAVFLAYLGQGINRMIFGEGVPQPTKGWRETWRRWMWAHPVIGGALIGLFVPGPEMLPGVVGAVVWYGAAGAFAPLIYRKLEAKLQRNDNEN